MGFGATGLVRLARRAYDAVGLPGIALGVVGAAFAGGILSGAVESTPAGAPGAPPPASSVPSAPSTSVTPMTFPIDVENTVKAQLVNDLGVDMTAQRIDLRLRQRLALATSPATVAQRRAELAQVWAADALPAAATADTDAAVAWAKDPTAPSFTQATFVPTQWLSVTVTGGGQTADVAVVGHFRLREPGNLAAAGGVVDKPDGRWLASLRLVGTRWLLEGRTPG